MGGRRRLGRTGVTRGTPEPDQVVVEYARRDGKPLTSADFDQIETLLPRMPRPCPAPRPVGGFDGPAAPPSVLPQM